MPKFSAKCRIFIKLLTSQTSERKLKKKIKKFHSFKNFYLSVSEYMMELFLLLLLLIIFDEISRKILHLASLAKWLVVHLQIKWLLVRFPLQSLKF